MTHRQQTLATAYKIHMYGHLLENKENIAPPHFKPLKFKL